MNIIVDFLSYNNVKKSWGNLFFVICGICIRILGNCYNNLWMVCCCV